MAELITETLDDPQDEEVSIVLVDRDTLYKRRWRATAQNGTELAINLPEPVANGTHLRSTVGNIYTIQQTEEELIIIKLPSSTQLSTQLGWFLGNQHLPIEVREDRILMQHQPTLIGKLERIGIPYSVETDIFNCKFHSHIH